MSHPLKCQCGTLRGIVNTQETVNRAVCYCRDCQAFAHYLSRAGDVLDERAGTEVLQILPKHVHLSTGLEALACMRLTNKGLLRWYTDCCKTPIGNTLPSRQLSFVGLVRSCLDVDHEALDTVAGPVRVRANTKGAEGDPKPKAMGVPAAAVRIMAMIARARIDGSYKLNPFFNVADGTPVARPEVLSPKRLAQLKGAGRS